MTTTRYANKFLAVGDTAGAVPGLKTVTAGTTITSPWIKIGYGMAFSISAYLGSAAATTYDLSYQTLGSCTGWQDDQPTQAIPGATQVVVAGAASSTTGEVVYDIDPPLCEAIRVIFKNSGANPATATAPNTTYPFGLGGRVIVYCWS